jgi:two-component system, OmpR family, heavy metal sensor histidine kinase CusS
MSPTNPSASSHSIAKRLSQRLAAFTMAVLTVLFGCAWWSVTYTLDVKNGEDVAEQAHALAEVIELEARTGGEASVRARLAADAPMRMGSKLELWDADGKPFFADALDSKRRLSAHVRSADVTIGAPGLPGNTLKVRYTKDLAREHAMAKRWAWGLALFALGASALVGLGSHWQVRQRLKPLNDLAAQTRAITPQHLHQRLHLNDPPAEALPWIEQFNALMARTDRAYSQLEGFNADVAHELRTPLATLIMQAELALSRPRSVEDLREAVTSGLEELQRMSTLVNDMLFLSQSDRGAKARRGKPASLAALALEVVEYHEAALEDAGLKVDVVGEATVAMDEPLVQRAVSNLVSNATRFAQRGSTVRVVIAPDGVKRVRLDVENEGPPIDVQQLPRLFDRFYRADVSRHGDDGVAHFGLGLAIVSAIARMHGGEPSAVSQQGRTRIGLSLVA